MSMLHGTEHPILHDGVATEKTDSTNRDEKTCRCTEKEIKYIYNYL